MTGEAYRNQMFRKKNMVGGPVSFGGQCRGGSEVEMEEFGRNLIINALRALVNLSWPTRTWADGNPEHPVGLQCNGTSGPTE